MSDKKEIATLSIKISVDSTDLDKLEAQLKRIAGLMVNVGLKQPAKGGFTMDFDAGQVLINAPLITSGTIASAKIDNAMRSAAKEAVKKGAEDARFKITTGINHNHEQQSAIATLESSAEITRLSKVMPREDSEFEMLKGSVAALMAEKEQVHASIESIRQAIADSNHAQAETVRQFAIDMQRSRSGFR